MGEVAEQVGQFVNAYSGDLKDESLDGQRLVVGGIVTGFRTIITKAKSTMGVATLEDLQGTIEVVVFPKLYEQTVGIWREGSILLVAGRVDHRGEEVSLLADLVMEWDSAIAAGPEAFGRQVAAGDRGSFRRRGAGGNGQPNGASNGHRPDPQPVRDPVAVGPGMPASVGASLTAAPVRVSPLRTDAAALGAATAPLPPIAPAEPIPTWGEPVEPASLLVEEPDEPALPDEARAKAAGAAAAPTEPLDPGAGRVLHVKFAVAAGDRVVPAMEAFRQLLRDRPGGTRVVLHLPGRDGGEMELRRGVAYDAELLAEVRRRLGDGVVELRLA
jgi:hypothetical protein